MRIPQGTEHSNRLLAVASSARLDIDGRQLPSAFAQFNGAKGEHWAWTATPDQPATLFKIVSMVPGDTEDCGDIALLGLRRARRAGLRRLQGLTSRSKFRIAKASVDRHRGAYRPRLIRRAGERRPRRFRRAPTKTPAALITGVSRCTHIGVTAGCMA